MVPSPQIRTPLEAIVFSVMQIRFGQNWPRTFRGVVENVKDERTNERTNDEVGLVKAHVS